MSLIIYISLSIIIIMVLLLLVIGNYFFNKVVLRSKKTLLDDNHDLDIGVTIIQWEIDNKWLESQPFEDIELVAFDGLILHGYYLLAKNPTNKTVILAHGYTSKGMELGGFTKFYFEILGFNVLIPDNRGHGLSEGNYIGFGWHDRKDYLGWIDYVIIKNGSDSQIILHGISIGAATVLMVSGEALNDNIKCIISDCAYTSAKDILAYQMKKMYNLSAIPLIQITSLICKIKAGYYFGEASAVKQVNKAKKPILFIHGEDDLFVPTKMVYSLYEKCKSYKELFIVPKACHANAYHTDTKGYQQKATQFIDKYISC